MCVRERAREEEREDRERGRESARAREKERERDLGGKDVEAVLLERQPSDVAPATLGTRVSLGRKVRL